MRRGAYHSVVKRETNSVLDGQMTVYNVGTELIGISQGCEYHSRVTFSIRSFAYADSLIASKIRQLLLIAENGAIFGLLRVS